MNFMLNCPIPISDYPRVLMAHGGGGRLMQQLIEKMFRAAFDPGKSGHQHDGEFLDTFSPRLAFTTDTFVVNPLFFPGGDIGKLAVDGTVNDLAMCGARPVALSAAFIMEEGLEMETLWRVVESVRREAERIGVSIVTGDTKVVERGKGDGLFINTAGIGAVEHSLLIAPQNIQVGDAIILSGDIGRHGIAVMAARAELALETEIASDCAPLWEPVKALLDAGVEVHCLRDLTRGGLGSVLVEIAGTTGKHLHFEETLIPVAEEVRAVCELLGFEPLYVANEGRFVAFVPQPDAEKAVNLIRRSEKGSDVRIIGEVQAEPGGRVTMKSVMGTDRMVEMLSGEQLPRIC